MKDVAIAHVLGVHASFDQNFSKVLSVRRHVARRYSEFTYHLRFASFETEVGVRLLHDSLL